MKGLTKVIKDNKIIKILFYFFVIIDIINEIEKLTFYEYFLLK